MMQSRTHTCGELRLANAGQTVTLAGFMENVREVGAGLAFIVLRDFYGEQKHLVEKCLILFFSYCSNDFIYTCLKLTIAVWASL